VPYAKNARTHSEEQIEQIAHAIEQWGWTVPCLVDEKGGLIAGHGRVLAAKQLGLDEVPVMVARSWGKAQKRAYVIADKVQHGEEHRPLQSELVPKLEQPFHGYKPHLGIARPAVFMHDTQRAGAESRNGIPPHFYVCYLVG
jgi:hypothetical protein